MDSRVHIMGLIISCPLNTAVEHCPFNRYRNTPITGLIEVTNNLSPEEVIAVSQFHRMCLKERLKSKKAS